MKNFTFLPVLLVATAAFAYQAGPANRTNFGTAQQAEQPSTNYRAFSNYNNRSWGHGVQTKTVQTDVAGTSAVDFDKNTPQKLVSKVQAAPAKSPAKESPKEPKPAVSANNPAAASTAAAPANMDPAAMMQQVQGMMSAMSTMTGGNNAQSNGQAPAAMPDISALMGGAMPAAPAAAPAPAKK